MKKTGLITGLSFLVCLLLVSPGRTEDLKASVPEFTETKAMIELVKAIDDVYTEGTISIKTYPFARSIENVITGKADFHLPFLVNPLIPEDKMDFAYSTVDLFYATFVLYTNTDNKEISPDNLEKFNIETDRAHVGYFGFPIKPSNSAEASLKKISLGRIDGYIFPLTEVDPILKKLGLKNIKRQVYKKYNGKFVLNKGERGRQVDKILSKAIAELQKDGRFDKILGRIVKANESFEEW